MAADARPGIAVVVPTLNEAARIGQLVRGLEAMGFAEIVVADGGSSDGTDQIVAAISGVRLVRCRPGRGPQLDAGVRATTSPLLLLLHADTSLPENAVALICQTLADPGVSGGCFRLRFDRKGTVLDISAWFSRFETSFTTFGDQAFFLRRSDFDAIGGIPDIPFLEDLVLRERMKRQGRFVKCRECVETSARRFETHGAIRTQLRNLLILLAYRCGVPASLLARWYKAVR